LLGTIQKILVIKLRYIGDVLLTTPVLSNVRINFPKVKLDVLVNSGTEEVLSYNRDIDSVLLVERGSLIWQYAFIKALRRTGYDLVIDLTDSDRSAIISFLTNSPVRVGYNSENRWRGWLYTHVVPANCNNMHIVDYQLEALHFLKLLVKTKELRLLVAPPDDSFVKDLVHEYKLDDGRPVILMHPGARWWFKSWPVENFARLADALQQKLNCHVVLSGSQFDQGIIGEIQALMRSKVISLAGITTIIQLAALLKYCTLYVGNDNGVMHVAAAMRTPVVAFFGLTNPLLWGPLGSGHRVFYKKIDCSPCWPKGCVRGDQSCMRQITVEEVFIAVQKMLLIGKKSGKTIQGRVNKCG